MDTGSSHDLTMPSGAEGYDMQKVRRIVFSTANGRISTDHAMNLISTLLRGPATPYVLPDTPWVLFIGKRVMQMGYSFVWIAKTQPWLIAPDGHRIKPDVHGNIPFLSWKRHCCCCSSTNCSEGFTHSRRSRKF